MPIPTVDVEEFLRPALDASVVARRAADEADEALLDRFEELIRIHDQGVYELALYIAYWGTKLGVAGIRQVFGIDKQLHRCVKPLRVSADCELCEESFTAVFNSRADKSRHEKHELCPRCRGAGTDPTMTQGAGSGAGKLELGAYYAIKRDTLFQGREVKNGTLVRVLEIPSRGRWISVELPFELENPRIGVLYHHLRRLNMAERASVGADVK